MTDGPPCAAAVLVDEDDADNSDSNQFHWVRFAKFLLCVRHSAIARNEFKAAVTRDFAATLRGVDIIQDVSTLQVSLTTQSDSNPSRSQIPR